ncbi:MAG TPA: extracellular solute-binding protein [Acidimicrobiales bacterium]|nr:extracellular solute-binding protein [Acidimicrobiales bacterium]
MTLRLALVGGPMYDGLNEVLSGRDVEIVVHADHPTLNREVAERLAAGERLDLISTHSKYAPSQAQWLRALDDLASDETVGALAPAAVDLCRFGGGLMSLPRNIDVRVLWWRTDCLDAAPSSWAQLTEKDCGFGFPGRESGLFGTFFELVVGNGGRLFSDEGKPVVASDVAVEAVETLCRLAARAPADLSTWHYDQVDEALLEGRIWAAAAWPGAYGPIRDGALAGLLAPAPYPAGRERWVSYSGCHSWAIPNTCGDLDGALGLLELLGSESTAALDAQGGSIPAHVQALGRIQPTDGVDAQRLAITRRTIEEAMITYPGLTRFPSIEEAGWRAINAALTGRCSAVETVDRIQHAAEEALS